MRILTMVVGVAIAMILAMPSPSARTVEDALRSMNVADLEGTTWGPERLHGRVTLIDFWATWCGPCLTELPYLRQARTRHSRDEFEILGISFDVSDRRTLQSWLNRHHIDWPQVFDGRGRRGPVARHFGVSAVPTSFLVGATGELVGMNLRGEKLLAAIDAEVAQLRASR